jgi:uncharacterized coiled-coil DUF342 family protein
MWRSNDIRLDIFSGKMTDFLFSRFREADQLTLTQEADRRDVARRRARESRPRPTIHSAQGSPRSIGGSTPNFVRRAAQPGARSSTRAFVPADAELYEIESLCDQKLRLKREIRDIRKELQPLRQKARDLERVQSDIDDSNRYFVTHFHGDSGDVGKIIKQRESQQIVLRLQRESDELQDRIDQLQRELAPHTISALQAEVLEARQSIHDFIEQCDSIAGRIDANVRCAEAFKISTLYEEVQANRLQIDELQEELRIQMSTHKELNKVFLAADSGEADIDAEPKIVDLKEELRREQRRFNDLVRFFSNRRAGSTTSSWG